MHVKEVVGVGFALVVLAVFGLVLASDEIALDRTEAVPHRGFLAFKAPVATLGADAAGQEAAIAEALGLTFTPEEVAAGLPLSSDGVITTSTGLPSGSAYFAIWSSAPLLGLTLMGASGLPAPSAATTSAQFASSPVPLMVDDVDGYLYLPTSSWTPATGYEDYNGTCSVGAHTDRTSCTGAGGSFTPRTFPAGATGGQIRSPQAQAPAAAQALYAPGLRLEFAEGTATVVRREYPVPGMRLLLIFAPFLLALGLVLGLVRRMWQS